ncbi:MAG: endonuclease/exonuclease/phosphatase family protein [Actinomycetes bacterium]
MRFGRRPIVLIAALLTATSVGGVAGAGTTDLATPLCGATKGTNASAPSALRVASYNMLHGLTDEGDRTLEARLAIDVDELAASHVDMVGIQEAEESTKHGRVIARLASQLTARTGTPWYWCWFRTEPHLNGTPDTRHGGGNAVSDLLAAHYNSNESQWYEGAAVLSRWPIVASAVHRLVGEDPKQRLQSDCRPPQFSGDPTCVIDIALEPRAAVWTRIATPYGALSFTSSHTSGNWAQSVDLARWAGQQSRNDPSAVMVCDCNSVPSSRAQQVIRSKGWVDTFYRFGSGGGTADQDIGAATPTTTYRIDYVFVRSRSAHRPVAATPFMSTPEPSSLEPSGWLWPSDHWGVLTTLS